ncbi:hypothetical protein Ae406Ps2_6094 [Pseudonocardia sp. Ae406_Ps2]|nr:hypothetical protein Ae331Ps2_6077c [Pseudonocardia sp. Ae331_Ps2]OLL96258.1 hypothetical protein Ae406Ps2_6094 [Pseudonocardia sp. Ae406_Ps2]OLM09700.1 hypothetical protein Ae706Ps2_6162c [Pseudonocardia sp. Ae706_Ps2]
MNPPRSYLHAHHHRPAGPRRRDHGRTPTEPPVGPPETRSAPPAIGDAPPGQRRRVAITGE